MSEHEEWRDVVGYEGLYQVSSLGRVRSTATGRIYGAPPADRRRGGETNYRVAHLKRADGIRRSFPVHRLVALAFLPNPEHKPVVNHRDGDRRNNRLSNLEWATYGENSRHAVGVLDCFSRDYPRRVRPSPLPCRPAEAMPPLSPREAALQEERDRRWRERDYPHRCAPWMDHPSEVANEGMVEIEEVLSTGWTVRRRPNAIANEGMVEPDEATAGRDL